MRWAVPPPSALRRQPSVGASRCAFADRLGLLLQDLAQVLLASNATRGRYLEIDFYFFQASGSGAWPLAPAVGGLESADPGGFFWESAGAAHTIAPSGWSPGRGLARATFVTWAHRARAPRRRSTFRSFRFQAALPAL